MHVHTYAYTYVHTYLLYAQSYSRALNTTELSTYVCILPNKGLASAGQ